MTEIETLAKIDELLCGLDDAARSRAVAWIAAKHGTRARSALPRPEPAPLPGQPVPLPFIASAPNDATRKCMFDGLPPGVYGMVCNCPKCSVQCAGSVTLGTVFNTTAASLPIIPPQSIQASGGFIPAEDTRVYGPGPSLPGGVYGSKVTS